ncbi:MAG: S41 family peptidase [Victivallaceae bacterium]|nr:S41 family peptidase [Victivallaceae bacterium]
MKWHIKYFSRKLPTGCLILFIALPVWCSDVTKTPEKSAGNKIRTEDAYQQVARFMKVMQLIRRYYVNEDKVSYDKLFKGAINGMLHELDPYSRYELPKSGSRNGGGVGLVVIKERGTLKVVAPFGNSPAYHAGIRPGDIILKIDGERLYSFNMNELQDKLKGKPGTKITLTVLRRSANKILKFKIVRKIIKPVSIPANGVKLINKNIGYIRLNRFSSGTPKLFTKALEKLEKKNIKGLIIDLRNNSGGIVTAAIAVCSHFLPKGKLLITAEGRNKAKSTRIEAMGGKKMLDIPLVLLVNGYSASSSEIVAAALKDHKRAVLVGSKTFGKAYVQRLQQLKDGSRLRFTIAQYYSPNRQLIHGRGIEPDIAVPLSPNYQAALAHQNISYPGEVKPKIKQAVIDLPLKQGVSIIHGIILYKNQ